MPMPATTRELHRTAIAHAAAPITAATASPTAGAIRSYSCVAAVSDA